MILEDVVYPIFYLLSLFAHFFQKSRNWLLRRIFLW